MKSIIEKLGITPGPWILEYEGSRSIMLKDGKVLLAFVYASVYKNNEKEDTSTARFVAAAPEMLEALIMFCLRCDKGEIRSKKTYSTFISIIEKATGKTWKEVKEIVENE